MWKLRLQLYADKAIRDLRVWYRARREADWWDILCWVLAFAMVVAVVVAYRMDQL